MNVFCIAGNIGQDAVKKQINGKDFVTFSVAENQRKVNKETGEVVDLTNWYNVLYRGDKVGDYLKKGTKVFVSGELTINTFRSETDGTVRVSRDIYANQIQLLGSSQDSQPQPQTAPNPQPGDPQPGDDLSF